MTDIAGEANFDKPASASLYKVNSYNHILRIQVLTIMSSAVYKGCGRSAWCRSKPENKGLHHEHR